MIIVGSGAGGAALYRLRPEDFGEIKHAPFHAPVDRDGHVHLAYRATNDTEADGLYHELRLGDRTPSRRPDIPILTAKGHRR